MLSTFPVAADAAGPPPKVGTLVPIIPPEPTLAAAVLTATLDQDLEMFKVPRVAPPNNPPASVLAPVDPLWLIKPVAQTWVTVLVTEAVLEPSPAMAPRRVLMLSVGDVMLTLVNPTLRTVAPPRAA